MWHFYGFNLPVNIRHAHATATTHFHAINEQTRTAVAITIQAGQPYCLVTSREATGRVLAVRTLHKRSDYSQSFVYNAERYSHILVF